MATKLKYFCLFLLLWQQTAKAQNDIDRTRTWIFGHGVGLYFDYKGKVNPLDTFYTEPLNGFRTYEGTGIWNTKAGEMSYYNLSYFLFNKYNKKLNDRNKRWVGAGYSECQASILTSLDDTSLYIFTSGYFGYDRLNMLDNTLDAKFTLLNNNSSECQAIVNHNNGKWQWIVSHSLLGDTLFSYLLSPSRLEECPVISHAGPKYADRYPGQGLMKFSPDGKYLFVATFDLAWIVCNSFNNQTGEVKELFRFKNLDYYPYGLEIMDDKLFCVIIRPRDIIYEYSLNTMDSASVRSSRRTVFDTSFYNLLGQIQRAPDGNMYVSMYEKNHLGLLKKQNGQWNFSKTPPLFGSKMCFGGFPSFNASYFNVRASDFKYSHTCHTHQYELNAWDTFAAHTHIWHITKGTQKQVWYGAKQNVTLGDTGKWKVEMIATNGIRYDTSIKTIEVFDIVQPQFLGPDIGLPYGSVVNLSLNAPVQQHCSYWWPLGDSTEKKGKSYAVKQLGNYVCKTTDKNFCHRYDTIQISQCDTIKFAEIIRNKDSLISADLKAENTWYKNNIKLNTKGSIKAQDTGTYLLVQRNAQGCYDTASIKVTFLYAGIKYIKNTYKIVPNPSGGTFEILGLPRTAAIKIYDIKGREIEYTKTNNTINLQTTSGTYWLQINNTGQLLIIE
jgi:hypothetical protein